jgi:hypothetical protein
VRAQAPHIPVAEPCRLPPLLVGHRLGVLGPNRPERVECGEAIIDWHCSNVPGAASGPASPVKVPSPPDRHNDRAKIHRLCKVSLTRSGPRSLDLPCERSAGQPADRSQGSTASNSDHDKDAEILVSRHQIAVLQRQLGDRRVGFEPTDRALLAALLHSLPGPRCSDYD